MHVRLLCPRFRQMEQTIGDSLESMNLDLRLSLFFLGLPGVLFSDGMGGNVTSSNLRLSVMAGSILVCNNACCVLYL